MTSYRNQAFKDSGGRPMSDLQDEGARAYRSSTACPRRPSSGATIVKTPELSRAPGSRFDQHHAVQLRRW
jgi:hypothetical protein